MKLLLLTAAAVLFCLPRASVTDKSRNRLRERSAISYVQSRIPELRAARMPSGSEWNSALFKIVKELDSSSEYRDMLEDGRDVTSTVAEPVPFTCQLERSPTKPTSVHKLRPADIDVIAALGDSLTAANGARATTVLGLLMEYRGYAWSIGGEVGFSQHVTLANLLMQQNPKLRGHSTGTGSVSSGHAVLNVAEPGNVAADILRQARSLVAKLKADPNVNYLNDWKIITILIGGNDACDYCKDKRLYSPENYIRHITATLDYLHANVPRAFVNVVEVLDVSLVKELKDGSAVCSVLLGNLLCRCAAFPENPGEEREIKAIIAEYQAQVRQLVDSGRYDTRDDFTVVSQPFFRNSAPPRINGKYDQSYLAPDCFHFSQKGHAESAKALWNNMIEPVGQKSNQWTPNGPFKCPTSSRPYFSTSKN